MKNSLLGTLVFCLYHFAGVAQSTGSDVLSKKMDNKYASSVDPSRVYQKDKEVSTVNVNLKTSQKTHKHYRKGSFAWQLEMKKKEYELRMIANVKKRNKMARLMRKPQYSDPSYFGHKRKPKKHPVGKRRLCKECGIVH